MNAAVTVTVTVPYVQQIDMFFVLSYQDTVWMRCLQQHTGRGQSTMSHIL